MKYIFTFLISMVPLVELRGAIPFAIANGIPLWTALLIGVIGNLLPVPLIFFFARHILTWGAKKRLSEASLAGVSVRDIEVARNWRKPRVTKESSGPYCSSLEFLFRGLGLGLGPLQLLSLTGTSNAVASQSCSE